MIKILNNVVDLILLLKNKFKCKNNTIFNDYGAARETRTLMDNVHTALNRACLPVSA